MSRHFVTLRAPDQGVEYVLAGRMWVLAGAPQELIDAEQGSVAGRVTQSLFARISSSEKYARRVFDVCLSRTLRIMLLCCRMIRASYYF